MNSIIEVLCTQKNNKAQSGKPSGTVKRGTLKNSVNLALRLA